MNQAENEPPLMLYAGDTLLGFLAFKGMGWPFTYFAFEPSPEFTKYSHILDVQGNRSVFQDNMATAEKLDLRVVREDGKVFRMLSVFIDGNEAMLRPGFI